MIVKKISNKFKRHYNKKKYKKSLEESFVLGSDYCKSFESGSCCGGDLKGKKILVTGGSSGLGFSICKRFLMEGAEVVITGRNHEKLLQAKEMLNTDQLHIYAWDLSLDFMTYPQHIKKIKEMLGNRIDVLVNNAGIYTEDDRHRNFLGVTEEQYDKIINTNLKSVYFLCQNVAKDMISEEQKGSIINIASINAYQYGDTPYGISKAGMISMTNGLAELLAKYDISISCIAPGTIATEMVGISKGDSIYSDKVPIKRYAIPEEIAAHVAFLASRYGRIVTGRTIICDGKGI